MQLSSIYLHSNRTCAFVLEELLPVVLYADWLPGFCQWKYCPGFGHWQSSMYLTSENLRKIQPPKVTSSFLASRFVFTFGGTYRKCTLCFVWRTFFTPKVKSATYSQHRLIWTESTGKFCLNFVCTLCFVWTVFYSRS